MEKLLLKAMANPTAKNKAAVIAMDAKRPMAICFLTREQVTILNQYKREA